MYYTLNHNEISNAKYVHNMNPFIVGAELNGDTHHA